MMGIVSDSQLADELKKNSNKPVVGRGKGNVEVPESLRKVIATDAIENGNDSAIELAESLGISASSVSAYKNGSTSTTTYNKRDKELNDHNNEVRSRIAGKARSKLLSALRHITPEKLQEAKLKDVAGVARDMSAIVRNMEPRVNEDDSTNSPKVAINIFAPQRREEREYKVITVND